MTPHPSTPLAALALLTLLVPHQGSAQGLVPPPVLSVTNPLGALNPSAVPATNVQSIHMVHLPSDPPNVFTVSMAVESLGAALGGFGSGLDLLTGKYDVLARVFTPNARAAALNTPLTMNEGIEFGMVMHPNGLLCVWDEYRRPPRQTVLRLGRRPDVTADWSVVGVIEARQSYYDASLADYDGVPQLIFSFQPPGATGPRDILMQEIDPATAQLVGIPRLIVAATPALGSVNSSSPICDSTGEILGLSHHARLAGTTGGMAVLDHYVSLDLDPATPPVELLATPGWTNNGGFAGGSFFDIETTSAPGAAPSLQVFQIDTYFHPGARRVAGRNTVELSAYVPPSTSTNRYQTTILVSAGPFASAFLSRPIRIPGIGLWGLDPTYPILPVSLPLHDNLDGSARATVTLPMSPSLDGLRLATQSYVFDISNASYTLGNTAQIQL